jgi:hypothetical protein
MKFLILLSIFLIVPTLSANDSIDPHVYIWQNPITNEVVVIIPDKVETLSNDGLFVPNPDFVPNVLLLDNVIPTVKLDEYMNPEPYQSIDIQEFLE